MTNKLTNTRRATLLYVWLAFLVVAAAGIPCFARGSRRSPESSIKAAYVYNFAKLTTWPSDGDITIGIVGSSDAGETIKRIVDGKSVGSHTISVKSVGAGEAKSCQIVFVCGSGGVPPVGSAHVLVVGEADGFADGGGAIGFDSSDGKVHFSINMSALKKAGLKISDKLKAIGRVIE